MKSGKTKTGKDNQGQGEKSLMESPAGILMSEESRWCMGKCNASPHSLAFLTDHQVVWSCPYKDIVDLHIEERPFAFGAKKTLKIEYKVRNTIHDSRFTKVVWLVLVEHERLEKIVKVRAFPHPVLEEDVCLVAGGVDSISEQFLWYLWKKQHATIDELTALGIVGDPEEILKKIKGVINPTANAMLGYPLFVFRGDCWSIFDPMSNL